MFISCDIKFVEFWYCIFSYNMYIKIYGIVWVCFMFFELDKNFFIGKLFLNGFKCLYGKYIIK